METKQNQTKTICSLQWRGFYIFSLTLIRWWYFQLKLGVDGAKAMQPFVAFSHPLVRDLWFCLIFTFFFNKYFENCSFPSSSPSTSFLLISLFHLCLWEYKTVKGGCHQVQSTSTGVANLLWVNDTHNACVVWATGNPSVAGSTWTQRQENSRTV